MRDEKKIDEFGMIFLRMFAVLVLMSIALLVSGCTDASKVPVQPVAIKAHDYCRIAQKIDWDIADTPGTIQGVRRENAKWDRRCLKKRVS